MTITYRQDDPISGRWSGVNRHLTNYEGDLDKYQLDQRIATLESNYAVTVSLASISQPTPSTLLFTLTDSTTRGPYTLPVSTFRDRGDWAATTSYLVNDTFIAPDGGLYRVIFDHTSAVSFSPTANDGLGHDYYAAMIPPRGNAISAGGAVAMYYRKNSSTDYDANWAFVRAIEVTFSPSTDSTLVSTNVAAAIEELEHRITTVTINAIDVVFTIPSDSTLVSTNVSGAITELEIRIESLTASDFGLGTGNSPQFAAINVGDASDTTISRASAGIIAVEGTPLYSNIPQNSKSAAYTTVLADAQKHILHPSADTTARTFTIDSNANVPYPVGTAITFVNQHSAGIVTIAITADTMRLAGTGSTGSRTLAADGIATALKITATEWIISGAGLT